MARGAGRVADSIAAQWLTTLTTAATYVSLSTGDPYSVSDPRTLEPGGPVYARCGVRWNTSGRLAYNANPLTWVGIPANSVITYIVGWDAPFNGNVVFSTPVPPLSYGEQQGAALIIDEGEFFVGIDA